MTIVNNSLLHNWKLLDGWLLSVLTIEKENCANYWKDEYVNFLECGDYVTIVVSKASIQEIVYAH